MYRSTSVWLIAVMVSFASTFAHCDSASATTLFYDNLQSDTAGTYSSEDGYPTENLDPVIGAGDVGGSWTINYENPATTGIQVLNNTTPGQDGAGTNNYVSMRSTSYFSAGGWTTADTDREKIWLSFDIWVPSGTPTGRHSIVARGPGNQALFNAYFFGDGTISSLSPEFVSTGLTIPLDSWQHISFVADMAANTFVLTAGGGNFNGQWTTDGSGATAVDKFWISGGSPALPFTGWDNVQLGIIPEPSAVTLLFSGLLGLFAYAWRRRK